MRLSTAHAILDAARSAGIGQFSVDFLTGSGNRGSHALKYTNIRDLLTAVALAAHSIDDPLELEHFVGDLSTIEFHSEGLRRAVI